jgi:hypothetical protein
MWYENEWIQESKEGMRRSKEEVWCENEWIQESNEGMRRSKKGCDE